MRRHSPYNYGFDNPIRFMDPDGMAPNDWVEWQGKNGQKHITFDAEVTTVAQAQAKGFNNVEKVLERGVLASENGDVYNLGAGGMYSVNNGEARDISDGGITTAGGTYINKNMSKLGQTATMMQATGDGIKVGGLASGLLPLAGMGDRISSVGLGMEVYDDLTTKGASMETATAAAIKVGLNFGFGELSEIGIKATGKAFSKESLEAGANRVAESIIQGTTHAWGKLTEFVIGEEKKR